MCYSAQMAAEARIVERLHRIPFERAFELIVARWNNVSRWTGAFGRPIAPIFTDGDQGMMARWTYLPPEIQDNATADRRVNSFANCMAETMFSKPTWRDAAASRRGVLVLESYYEHQHRVGPKGGKVTIPYRFYRPGGDVIVVGVLWGTDWEGTPCFAVCTMPPTNLARWIHNSKDAINGPRQPLMLRTDEEIRTWIRGGPESGVEHLWTVRDDGYVVAEITEGSTGKLPAKLPKEPDGRPEGVVERQRRDATATIKQQDLF